jgi:hypothetical protein
VLEKALKAAEDDIPGAQNQDLNCSENKTKLDLGMDVANLHEPSF